MRLDHKQAMLSLWAFLAFALIGTAGSADSLKGTFTMKGPDDGQWTMTFDGKGKFTISLDKKLGVAGKYKVTKNEIEFTDESGPVAEKGDNKTGTYKWKLDGDKLTFTKVNDNAPGRSAALTNGPWLRKKD